MKKISNFLYQLSGEKNFSWLLEKRFWILFSILSIFWLLIYWFYGFNSKPFLAVGKIPDLTLQIVFCLICSGLLFILQIATAAILPKRHFFVLVIFVLINYFCFCGFITAGVYRVVKKFETTGWIKKIIAGFVAFWIFTFIFFLFLYIYSMVAYPILRYFFY